MYERPHIEILKKRIKEPRKFIQVLVGPRQVGKTTLAMQFVNQLKIPLLMESADAVPAGGSIWLGQVWETARLKKKSVEAGEFVLVIDEIQKIRNWSEIVKKLWDEDTRDGTNIKLILLGSSRLLMQQGLTESLVGRFEIIYIMHWTLPEMEKAFGWDADKFALYGGYPGAAELVEDENRWKRYIKDSIIETSISKDILMLTRVDKPALMKNLFEIGCLYSGQILSFTKIIGQLQDSGNTITLSHYLKLMETAGLLGGIEKYAANIIRKRASSPKFQVFNNALLNAQQNGTLEEIRENPKKWGRNIESAIGAYLINFSATSDYSLYYWRDGENEVDFILERHGKVIAIEVKSIFSSKHKGMEAIKKRFNPDKIYLIENKSLPWFEFLKINPADLF